jgi:phage shock protein B
MEWYEALIPLTAVLAIFVGMPWLLMHYMTKWKQAKSITIQDEDLLDELHDIARRLADRMETVERLIASDRADAAQRAFEPRQNDPRLPDPRISAPNVELHPQLRRKDQSY